MPKLVRYYILSVGAILGVAAIAKIVSVFGTARVLLIQDPLIGISFRKLIILAGVVELVIASLCLSTNRLKLNSLMVAWLSTSFVVYRFGLWWINWQRPCHCLGNLTDALHIPPQTADTVMKFILAYLLIGSYTMLFWFWRQKSTAVSALAPSGTSAPSPVP
jgi:hypothetical protein